MNIRIRQHLTKDQAAHGAMAGNLGFNLLEVMIAMAIFFMC
ncbi:MAG: prepilin-type N-terminal cleavage/methylation domain-containing protein, partial [Verrucomicrobia bacterium]|nr:prepilin-type N-terminal cleavage/methylation domain-containing protein [Verrucomicrobiota bacterium]